MGQVDELYTTLQKTILLLNDSDGQFFDQYQLGSTRFYSLVHLQAEPGLSLSELSRRLLCTKGNATRIMNSLESDGLIRREVDPGDNRALRFFLTSAGESLLGQARQAYQEFNQKRFGCLSVLEQGALQGALETLNAQLSELVHLR